MATIDSRMTPDAEYARDIHDRMDRSREQSIEEQDRSERIRENVLDDNRRDQQRLKEAESADSVNSRPDERAEGKGVSLDEMA